MTTSSSDMQTVRAVDVKITEDELSVSLEDGRTLAVPLAWFPRLLHGTKRERSRWRLIGRGVGIHWPELDEDLSTDGLIAGRRSNESQESLKRWLEARVSTWPNKLQPKSRKKPRRRKATRSGAARG